MLQPLVVGHILIKTAALFLLLSSQYLAKAHSLRQRGNKLVQEKRVSVDFLITSVRQQGGHARLSNTYILANDAENPQQTSLQGEVPSSPAVMITGEFWRCMPFTVILTLDVIYGG